MNNANENQEYRLLPSALALILVGLLFAYFQIVAFDIDLLIDAVGFLLAYNGLKALRRANEGFFGIAGKLCLLLVPISIAQLFFLYGVPPRALLAARYLFEALLYIALARSTRRVLSEKHGFFAFLARGAFLLNALGAVVCIPLLIFAEPLHDVFSDTVILIFRIILLVVLGIIFLSMPLESSRAKIATKRDEQRAAQQVPPPTPAVAEDDEEYVDIANTLLTGDEPEGSNTNTNITGE